MSQQPQSFADIYTPEGESLTGQPWQAYPRPRMKRDSFFNLNGDWEFAASESQTAPAEYDMTIRVPFAPESLLSGVHKQFSENCTLFYRKRFRLPEGFVNHRVLLHFGAVDQIAEVIVNGHRIGEHVGGYEPFHFDVTDALNLDGENVLEVRVTDHMSNYVLPYGKQSAKRGGIWYTPTTGIWQTVWMESVYKRSIHAIHVDTGENWADIFIEGDFRTCTIEVETPSGVISSAVVNNKIRISPKVVRKWSPKDPYLYRFTVQTGHDRVESYFALRTLEVKTIDNIPRLCLNGKPYFFHGLLDQGYWSDGILTPAAPECYERDIMEMKKLGFNTLRKHIKIEPQQFYYDCDRLGMVVFQDMVNNGRYDFKHDSILPMLGFQKLSDKKTNPDSETRRQFLDAMEKTVALLRDHPCICYWTIFNEGWGQFESAAAYDRLKKLDSTRFIDATSGWFQNGKSDVDSHHVYFKPYKFKPNEKPVVLSEFGGFACNVEEHVFNLSKQFGYKKFATLDALEDAIVKLYEEEIIPAVEKGLCASIYTQVSDVEDEINGLLTYDRKVTKVSADRMKEIAAKLTI